MASTSVLIGGPVLYNNSMVLLIVLRVRSARFDKAVHISIVFGHDFWVPKLTPAQLETRLWRVCMMAVSARERRRPCTAAKNLVPALPSAIWMSQSEGARKPYVTASCGRRLLHITYMCIINQ